ncbi:unnamed protein product [Somion occarium]|uniref:non-specific serine/threonine protein kinase n=1 Tax=Somion occarium TaxID=3059160 RepID=A0ABP1D6K4_9APHY
MAFFTKIKILLRRNRPSIAHPHGARHISSHPCADPPLIEASCAIKPPQNTSVEASRASSLLTLAKAARGQDAELVYPRLFFCEIILRTIRVQRPLTIGVLASFVAGMMSDGISVRDLNRLLNIDCGEYVSGALSLDVAFPSRVISVVRTAISSETQEEEFATIELSFIDTLSPDNISSASSPSPSAFITDESTLVSSTTISPKYSSFQAFDSLYSLSALPSFPDDTYPTFPLPVTASSSEETPAFPPSDGQLQLRDFDIVRPLGAGGFGTVYHARLKATGGHVAVKVMKKRVGSSRNHLSHSRTGEDVFGPVLRSDDLHTSMGTASLRNCAAGLDELIAMRRSEGIKEVVELLGSWHDSQNFYLVMPFCPGGDLQSVLDKRGQLPVEHARFCIADILNGLTALHSRGIIHRDIKPANILVGSDGRIKIADLGLARCFENYACEFEKSIHPTSGEQDDLCNDLFSEVTAKGCGTPEYAAPELYHGHLYTYGVDIWALGVMSFKMLFGRSPWDKTDIQSLAKSIMRGTISIEKWERALYGVPEDAELFIRRALDMDPGTRPTAIRLKSHPFFKPFDWEGLANNTLMAPWIPGACKPFPQETMSPIDVGVPLNTDDDIVPYFNYISPQLANAPSTLPVLDSSSSSTSLSDYTNCPPLPPLIGYPLDSVPSSASGIHLPSVPYYGEMEFPHEGSGLNKPDNVDDYVTNLAHEESRSLSFSIPNWTTPVGPIEGPRSVPQASLDVMDLVKREDSGSLPFLRYRNPHQDNFLSSHGPTCTDDDPHSTSDSLRDGLSALTDAMYFNPPTLCFSPSSNADTSNDFSPPPIEEESATSPQAESYLPPDDTPDVTLCMLYEAAVVSFPPMQKDLVKECQPPVLDEFNRTSDITLNAHEYFHNVYFFRDVATSQCSGFITQQSISSSSFLPPTVTIMELSLSPTNNAPFYCSSPQATLPILPSWDPFSLVSKRLSIVTVFSCIKRLATTLSNLCRRFIILS